jgi:hypothetical protein
MTCLARDERGLEPMGFLGINGWAVDAMAQIAYVFRLSDASAKITSELV